MTVFRQSHKRLFNEAKRYIPGGVNSPVRSFKAVGGAPIFVKEGRGSRIYGEGGSPRGEAAGRGFIDYCMSWGALILGHAHPEVVRALGQALKAGTTFGAPTRLETELARLIAEAVPSIEQVRLTSSGTEAVMSAVRLARAYRGKDSIIRFTGSYHGHADYFLKKRIPRDFIRHTIELPFNDIERFKTAVKRLQKSLAAIIVEPVQANCGVILPGAGFLEGLRAVADRYGVILIFDEVITGFRLSYGGAQGYFGIKPDLTCLGKIVGGGLPLAAFGGRRDLMKHLAPEGDVYQAGTLSGNPIAVTAGIATLRLLKRIGPYKRLEKNTTELCDSIRINAEENGMEAKVNHLGSIFSIFFTGRDVKDYTGARRQDAGLFKRFYHNLLKEGVYLSPSELEANFLSTAHTEMDLEETMEAVETAMKRLS